MRVCGPYSHENPAFLDFPPILSRLMKGHVSYLDGGLECNINHREALSVLSLYMRGRSGLLTRSPIVDTREIMELNEDQIRAECAMIKEKGINDVAIVGIFSPLDTKGVQEVRVKKIVQEEIPDADIVCSRDS